MLEQYSLINSNNANKKSDYLSKRMDFLLLKSSFSIHELGTKEADEIWMALIPRLNIFR